MKMKYKLDDYIPKLKEKLKMNIMHLMIFNKIVIFLWVSRMIIKYSITLIIIRLKL